MFKGITKRWMLNTLSVIFTIIVLIVVSLIFVITYVYQSSVEQTLSSAGNELSLVFSDYESDNTTSFNSSAREYVENFDRKANGSYCNKFIGQSNNDFHGFYPVG